MLKRFEAIGLQIMNRTSGGGPFTRTRSPACSATATSSRLAAQILGQAYVSAYNLVLHNKDAVETIADELVERREIFGDELVEMLDDAKLTKPEIDYTDEAAWPKM